MSLADVERDDDEIRRLSGVSDRRARRRLICKESANE